MKKLVLLLIVLMWPLRPAAAQGGYNLYGPFNIHIPLQSADVTYLYDARGNRSLVGAETLVLSAWKLEGTVGGVTSLDGQGTPFISINLAMDNPLATHLTLGSIKLGAFGGFDFRNHAFIVGPKAAVSIF